MSAALEQSPKKILGTLLSLLKNKGYKLYERPYELNIVGLRSATKLSGTFDDELFVFYKDNLGNYKLHLFPCTTDPGQYWLDNPMMAAGTALMKEGQYEDSYMIGVHRGKFKALVQRKPVQVYRVVDRQGQWKVKDPVPVNSSINIHSASKGKAKGKAIGQDSAGCQVVADPNHFQTLLGLADQHSKLYGNRFTYSLVDFRDYEKASAIGKVLVGIGLAAFILWGLNQLTNSEVEGKGITSRILDGLDESEQPTLAGTLVGLIPGPLGSVASTLFSTFVK